MSYRLRCLLSLTSLDRHPSKDLTTMENIKTILIANRGEIAV